MADKARVAIAVHEGKARLESLKISDKVTMQPGKAYEVDPSTFAVRIQIATGGLVMLGADEDPPVPEDEAPPVPATPSTAADFLS